VKLPRRRFLNLAAGAAALHALPRTARAQTYPTRPVRITVAFPAGSTSDILARLMGQWLSERLGQPFIIENRPGASGNIATEVAVRAPPDGYTLLMCGTFNTINAALYEKLNFNFIRDIAPVASIMRTPTVIEVTLSVPAKTVPEFIAYAKANPGKIAMGSAGNGTIAHVAGELFRMMTGVNMIHVPYRGAPPALTDLIGGQVQLLFDPVPTSLAYIRAAQLRPLAVTALTRLDVLPDVPPLSDFVPGYEASIWQGVGAPAKTPPEITDKLNKEVNAALADPKVQSRLADLGGVPMSMMPTELARFITDEIEKWRNVIKFAGIKAD
jgi:tripartite-type tricarboxylate transporter receptor subunit TctC